MAQLGPGPAAPGGHVRQVRQAHTGHKLGPGWSRLVQLGPNWPRSGSPARPCPAGPAGPGQVQLICDTNLAQVGLGSPSGRVHFTMELIQNTHLVQIGSAWLNVLARYTCRGTSYGTLTWRRLAHNGRCLQPQFYCFCTWLYVRFLCERCCSSASSMHASHRAVPLFLTCFAIHCEKCSLSAFLPQAMQRHIPFFA